MPQYHDAEESDVFVLSGAEDLVPVLRQDKDGAWIAQQAGHTRDADGFWVHDATGALIIHEDEIDGYRVRRYRPRIEGLFARIERWTKVGDPTDVSWRSISKDNVLTWYGRDAESRVADLLDSRRIFSWLISETRDGRGNVVRYRYKAEDGAGVTLTNPSERNRGAANDARRTAQRYLKRVLYGNLKALLGAQGSRPRFVSATDWAAVNWLFEVVLDYGEHDANVPTSTETASWSYRPDPFSSYRSGFEVRTTRLCQRVLMFHHFPNEPEVGAESLVRSVEFTYRYENAPADDRNPIYSRLLSVRQKGFRKDGAGGYLSKGLPPVEFEYSEPVVQSAVEIVPAESLENLPSGDASPFQWADLDGEGTPGLLTEQAGAWFCKRNWSAAGDGTVELGPLQRVPVQPNASLTGAQARFMDLAGDGQPDLAVLDGPVTGFYEHDSDGWQPFQPFPARLNRTLQDPNTRFIDLDGDGHADLLVTEDDALVWYPSLGEAGFSEARRLPWSVDEEAGPRLVFAEPHQTIFLADMSGDGLTDLVRIRNGEVCYWPCQGFARFGAKVTMDRSPWFDEPDSFDPRRLRVADVDGAGTADLLYLHRDGVRVFFNQSGNGWGAPHVLPAVLGVHELVSANTTDLLGNGTACLVWSSSAPADAARPMRYLNLMGGTKPHLLVRTANNLGAETHVQYAPSTRFYLQDLRAGRPWQTRLPFPVHVVERVENWDEISRNRFVTHYAYHEGRYDPVEREFVGFGLVEQWDSEQWATFSASDQFPVGDNAEASSHVPPVHTKTWYHTGAYREERDSVSRHFATQYFQEPGLSAAELQDQLLDDTILPAGLTFDEQREACRALKGLTLRQEVYADDAGERSAYPYTVTETNATVRCVQPMGGNRHAVFLTQPRESLSYHYERDPADPRLAHALTLEVDEFGSVLKEAAIGYGRRNQIWQKDAQGQWTKGTNSDLASLNAADQAQQTKTLATFTERRVTNAIDMPDEYRTPIPCEVSTFELTGYSVTRANGRLAASDLVASVAGATTVQSIFDRELSYEQVPSTGRERRLVERQRTVLRADDLSTLLPIGTIEPRGLPGEQYQLALTNGLIASVFQRPLTLGGNEPLVPDPAGVLGSADGGYLAGATLKADGRFPATDPDDTWWVPSGRLYYSDVATATAAAERTEALGHFYNVRRYRDAFGQDTRLWFDPYDLLLKQSQDPVGNQTTVATQDYRVLQPRVLSDANGNRTAAAYDALGLLVGTAVMGKAATVPAEGDSLTGFNEDLSDAEVSAQLADPLANPWKVLASATTCVIHDVNAYWRTRDDPAPKPAVVCTFARETHASDLTGGARPRVQTTLSYSDGFGREIQQKVRAEPDRNAPAVPRWVGSGWTIFNNKGNPVRQYEPFFTGSPAFEFRRIAGVSPILFYDPVDRVVATLHPDHSYEKVVFTPWRHADYDANDTCAARDRETGDPRTDPDISALVARYFASQAGWQTWAARHTAAGTSAEDHAAVAQSAVHAATPSVTWFDTLGRPYLVVVHNRMERDGVTSETHLPTRTALDIEGNTLTVRDAIAQSGDALGRIVASHAYDIRGQRVRQESMEAGTQWVVTDAADKPIRSWDSRGHNTLTRYDALHRPAEHYLRGTTADSDQRALNRDVLIDKTEYGESLNSGGATGRAEGLNLRGRVYRHFDSSGIATNAELDSAGQPVRACDFKGNILATTRQFLRDYQALADWLQNPALLSERFRAASRYDALNRPIQSLTPQSDAAGSSLNVIQPSFDDAGLLERVDVWLSLTVAPTGILDPQANAPAPIGVTQVEHDAKGQRQRIDYKNGVTTFYQYDTDTFRLVRVYTRRGAAFAGDADNPNPPPPTIAAPDDPSQIQTGGVQNISYTYDPVGNITAIRDTAQQTVFFRNKKVEASAAYTYDALYRLVEASGREHLGQAGGRPIPHSPSDSPRVRIDWAANDGNAMGRYRERYDYDAVGNFLTLLHEGTDPAQSGWTRTNTYAEASLLENGSGGTLTKTSNRLSRSVITSGAPPITETFTHDVHGNLMSMPHLGLGGTGQNMFWDGRDQLQRVDLGGGGSAFYVYDASGQRVRKVVERSPGHIEERLYLGATEIYRERSQTGPVTLERETLHVTDDRQRLAIVERRTIDTAGTDPAPARQIRYQHSNHLGSATLELDDQAGITSYEEYSPYGSTTYQAVRSVTDVPKRYRYTSKERDEESGFYYHGARFYAPWLGRWTACDPEMLNAGINVYQYCSSSPITRLDHTGTQDEASSASANAESAGIGTRLLRGAADAVWSLRQYTTSRALKINIDEIKAVSQRGSWWNPKNKQFLDWMTNQATKKGFTWTFEMPFRRQISLAKELAKGEEAFEKAAKSLMVRRFSEVKELKAITMAAKNAMRNLNRPRRELANAINAAIRGRIARAATEDARLVAQALRKIGIDPETMTFVRQEVAAAAKVVVAAGKTEQTVGALTRVTQAATKILRPLAPVAETVAKVARPLGFLAVGVQVATAKTTEDKANAAVSVLSTALLEAPHPVAKAAGAGLAAGQLLDQTLNVSDYSSRAGAAVYERLREKGYGENTSFVVGAAASFAAIVPAIGYGASERVSRLFH